MSRTPMDRQRPEVIVSLSWRCIQRGLEALQTHEMYHGMTGPTDYAELIGDYKGRRRCKYHRTSVYEWVSCPRNAAAPNVSPRA